MSINHNTNVTIRGPGTFETLTYEVIENPNTSGGIQTSETMNDTTYQVTTTPGTDNNFSLQTNAKLVNLTPEIIDVSNTTKSVTKRVNGIGKVMLDDGYSKVVYQRIMMSAGSGTTRNVTSFATGSLRKHIIDNMIASLTGVTRGGAAQSASRWNGSDDEFNTNMFLVGNKTGYTAPATDILKQALWADDYGDNNSKVWITPHHYLNFKTHGSPNGATWRVINGEIVVNYSPTRWNGTLARLLPANWKTYMPNLTTFGPYIPTFTRFKNNHGDPAANGRGDLVQPGGIFTNTRQGTIASYLAPLDAYQFRTSTGAIATGGDSGSPVFTIINGLYVAIGHVARGGMIATNNLSFYADHLTRIQEIVTLFNASGNFTIQTVNLS